MISPNYLSSTISYWHWKPILRYQPLNTENKSSIEKNENTNVNPAGNAEITLRQTPIGMPAIITQVGGSGPLRQHFLDMGVIPGSEVTIVQLAPMGDPMELRIHGYELTIRVADAEKIMVIPSGRYTEEDTEKKGIKALAKEAYENASHALHHKETNVEEAENRHNKSEHPGLGEAGRFHRPGDGDPLPDDTLLTFALVGNQNCGKTTLFNQLTGANQHVGNFPGVTVSRKDGAIRHYSNTLVTDLPGIYSMSPYSSEELISREFVLNEKPHAIINIIDATNIERNLYLTVQLLEMDIPMVVALNMMDEVRGNGDSIDVNKLESLLGVPVIPISAARGEGIEELVQHAIHVAHYQERPLRQDFCDENDHGGAVHRCLHAVAHLIEDHASQAQIPVRFASSRIIEGDDRILEKLSLDRNEKELLEHIIIQMENERGMDKSAAIADMRYSFIFKTCGETVKRFRESREHLRSRKIDKVLTGKYTAIPVFILIMGLVFYLTFNVIGAYFQGLLEVGIENLTLLIDNVLSGSGVNPVVHSLIVEGIFAGVGSVLSFIPIIVIMFLFLSLLEDSGYIARVAFVMDHLLRRIGLSGRSIVPMLIGFGCSVPAIMSTRTLPSERDRRMTILLTPFMSCTAKIPIYAFFVNAFFPGKGGLIMTGLYLLGIVTGILAAFLYKGTMFHGEAVPFVMELPNYRLPGIRNTLQLLWEKTKDFLQRAFSVILVATIVIWFLQNFDLHLNMVKDQANSMLALVSGLLVPLFKPVGLGDWRIVTSLISGFMAKESVVSTLKVLFVEGVTSAMTPLTAAGLLVFSLLYTPCVAAVSAIRRELGMKWAAAVVLWQCAVAWMAALIVHLIGILL